VHGETAAHFCRELARSKGPLGADLRRTDWRGPHGAAMNCPRGWCSNAARAPDLELGEADLRVVEQATEVGHHAARLRRRAEAGRGSETGAVAGGARASPRATGRAAAVGPRREPADRLGAAGLERVRRGSGPRASLRYPALACAGLC
jgi:hypothetical protein